MIMCLTFRKSEAHNQIESGAPSLCKVSERLSKA